MRDSSSADSPHAMSQCAYFADVHAPITAILAVPFHVSRSSVLLAFLHNFLGDQVCVTISRPSAL